MKKNKINRLILVAVCLIALLMLFWKILDTYAVFQSQVTGNVEFQKGIWNITVNEEEIVRRNR